MSVAGRPSVHAMDLWMATDFEAFDTLVSFGTAVDEHGLASPSLRTIAGYANCSAATLVNWFGSKRELHRRTLVALGVKWGHVLFGDLLPTDPQGRFYARLRLAYEEIARTDPPVAELLDELIALEQAIVAVWVRRVRKVKRVDQRTVMVLHALLLQLWDERTHPDAAAARSLLNETIDVLPAG